MAALGLTQPLITEGKTDAKGLYRNTFARAARPLDSKIMVSNGIFANMSRFGRSVIPEKCHEASNYLVTDEVCDGLFADTLLTGFRAAGLSVSKLVVPSVADESGEYSTEPSKNRGVFDTLIDEILEQGISKNSCIISLGGGVVNNICGVIASTLYRGITLVHLTTTTMGAFDAAIDFKQGINHPLGKNLIGTYWPATNILIDPTTFTSLSPRHMLNGVAEALKHGFCQSLELTELICRPLIDYGTGKLRDPQYLLDVCKACIEIKVPTLTHYDASDYNEMCPQYGHAIGHAVEHLSWHDGREPMLHGEAVAIGMVVSAEIAFLMGLCDETCVREHYDFVQATGLPAFVPSSLTIDDVLYKMSFDKHHVKKPTMGLPSTMGTFAKNDDSFAFEVDEEVIAQALQANMDKRPESEPTIRKATNDSAADLIAACVTCNTVAPMMSVEKLAPWASRSQPMQYPCMCCAP